MTLGVVKAKQTIVDIGELAVDVIAVMKTGGGFSSLTKILEIAVDIKDLVVDGPGALPELVDLTAAEAGELGAVAYTTVRKVLDSMKA